MEGKERASKSGNYPRSPSPLGEVLNATGDLEGIIQTQGYQAGKLFQAHDKATYTFIHDNEVVSLHFDLNKQDLFLKGHKLVCLSDHPQLPDFLSRFKKALVDGRTGQRFLTAFDAAMTRLNRL